jgi:hypothetical protein
MWESDVNAFAARFAISVCEARSLRCTAEHVVARRDGGRIADNIVAACSFCNGTRHRRRKADLTAEQFKALVQRRMAAGRWRERHLVERIRSALVADARAAERRHVRMKVQRSPSQHQPERGTAAFA